MHLYILCTEYCVYTNIKICLPNNCYLSHHFKSVYNPRYILCYLLYSHNFSPYKFHALIAIYTHFIQSDAFFRVHSIQHSFFFVFVIVSLVLYYIWKIWCRVQNCTQNGMKKKEKKIRAGILWRSIVCIHTGWGSEKQNFNLTLFACNFQVEVYSAKRWW